MLLWELLFLVALAVVRGLHLLRIAGALLGHFDLGQVALAAAHIVAALADITGNTDVFHIDHLSTDRMPRLPGDYASVFCASRFALRVTATCFTDSTGCTGSIRGPAQRITARIFSRISGL